MRHGKISQCDPCYGHSAGRWCMASNVCGRPLSSCLWQEHDRERNAFSFGMGRAVQLVSTPRMPQDLGFVRLVLTPAINLASKKGALLIHAFSICFCSSCHVYLLDWQFTNVERLRLRRYPDSLIVWTFADQSMDRCICWLGVVSP